MKDLDVFKYKVQFGSSNPHSLSIFTAAVCTLEQLATKVKKKA